MDFKSLLQSMDAISETVHKGTYGTEYQPDQPRDDYGHKMPAPKKATAEPQVKKGRGRPTKLAKDDTGADIKHDTSGIQAMLGSKPKGKVGKVSAKRKLKDWIEAVEENQLNEDSTERPYICVHAKKGKCEVKASSSYEAAKKAAAKWGLKSTSGIDSHLADVTHSGSSLEENAVTIKPMPGASQIIGADGKPIGTADMQTANLIKQASEKGTLSLGTDDQQGMAEASYSAKAARAGKDIGKPGKNFPKIAKDAAKRYGSKEAGERVAGAVLNKLRHPSESVDDMPAHALDRMNEPNKKFYTNNPNAMRADRERVSTGANTLSDKGHERAGGAYKVKPSDPNKGKVTRLPSSFKNIKESVLNDSTGSTLQHILDTYKRDVNDFKTTGELSSDLYDALYDYYFDDMPYGTKKARDGDPYEWIGNRFEADLGLQEGSIGSIEQHTTHGLDSKPSRLISVPAKQEPTPWGTDPIQATTDRVIGGVEKTGSFIKGLIAPKKNPFEGKEMKDTQLENWNKQLNALLTEGITVTSSTGQQGQPDSVSVNATDTDAQELLSVLRQAGVGVFGGDEPQGSPSSFGAPSHEEEPGNGTEIAPSPEVVGDGDDMLALIKKMSGIQSSGAPSGTADADYEEEESEEGADCDTCGHSPCECDHEEVSEGHDPVKMVKDTAKQYMQSTGINNVHDLDAEAIEYIGNECQINYEEVCKILGCELPAELGPVDADDEENIDIDINKHGIDPEGDYGQDEVEEGNAFTGALAKAKSDNIPDKDQKFKVGNKEYPVKEEDNHAHDEEDMCNECGYTMESCDCPAEEEKVEESYSNSADDAAMQDLQYMLQTLAGGANGPKRSQATGNITKVTTETKLFKDSSNLLTDWQKLSGIK